MASMWDRVRDAYLDWRFGVVNGSAPLGKRGEQAAARYLRRRGYRVISESESDRAGEIDLIVTDRHRRTLVFVEVKTLASTKPGHPADRVDESKQIRITRAALRFLKRHQMLETPCRFDVVAVWWPTDMDQPSRIEHYVDAFDATGVDGFFS